MSFTNAFLVSSIFDLFKKKEVHQSNPITLDDLEDSLFVGERIRQSKKIGAYLKALGFSPLPDFFYRTRVSLRTSIRQAKKDGDQAKLKESLDTLYYWGVVVCFCYGPHDCNSGILGKFFDDAVLGLGDIAMNFHEFSYPSDGKIKNCGYLSDTDWKNFTAYYGVVGKELDLDKELGDNYPGHDWERKVKDFKGEYVH